MTDATERLIDSRAEQQAQRLGLDFIIGKIVTLDATNFRADVQIAGETAGTAKAVPFAPDLNATLVAGEYVGMVLQASGSLFIVCRSYLIGATKPTAGPIIASADLSGDVAMTNANQFYDGPSVLLQPGRYLLGGVLTVAPNTSGGITVKLWDGSTVDASSYCVSANTIAVPVLGKATVVGAAATWKISAALTTVNGTIKAAAVANSPGNTASHLRALRIG